MPSKRLAFWPKAARVVRKITDKMSLRTSGSFRYELYSGARAGLDGNSSWMNRVPRHDGSEWDRFRHDQLSLECVRFRGMGRMVSYAEVGQKPAPRRSGASSAPSRHISYNRTSGDLGVSTASRNFRLARLPPNRRQAPLMLVKLVLAGLHSRSSVTVTWELLSEECRGR